MIFVTVGTELPFDRLVRVVDRWASDTGRRDVFAQIGKQGWRPAHVDFKPFLEPREFAELFTAATLIVSHAGMGTILSALQHSKPILVMPRRTALGEQRNDHQLATAHRLSADGRICVALDDEALRERLDHLDEVVAREAISPYANPTLLAALRRFILGESEAGNGATPARAGEDSE